MARIPGVTSEILKKKVLEALEGIGIRASDIMGKGTNVKRITSGKDINPFKPNMLQAMRGENKNMGDALDAFANEATYIMNANDGELVNFLNNLNTYKSIGGAGVDTQGVGSMFKAMKDLENAAKDLQKTTSEGVELAEKEMKKILDEASYGGPFKVPDEKFLGGSMHEEGQIRTGVRKFLETELNAGRLKLNEKDTHRVRNYYPTIEDDVILVFKRIYGDDAYKKAGTFPGAFEKGESFSHYEKIFRNNMGDEFLKIQNKENIGDGTLVLDESLTYKEPIDDPDIPFNQGGRVGLKYGGSKVSKDLINKIKNWANETLTNKKGLESMFKKVTEVDDEGKLIQKEILDPFITTADEMSGAKINMNRKLANKRSLAYAIDEWNKNPTKKYYRGEKSKKYLDDAKWLEDNPEFRKSFERELNRQVEEGWGKYGKSTYDEDLKGGFFSPHSGVARGYAQGKWHELPPVKKIELKPWEVQEALERNYENNPFVGPGDILLDKATRKKANLDWYESIKAKLGLAEGGRVGMVKGSGKKGVGSLIKLVDDKFGEGTLKTADDIARPEAAVEDEATRELFSDFNIKLTTQDLMKAAENKMAGPILTKNKKFLDPESTDHTTFLLQEEFFKPDAVDFMGEKVPSNWIALERAKAQDTLKELGPLPSRRHPNWEDMRKLRQGVKNRLVALDITEELGGNVAMFDFLRMERGMGDQFLDINNYIKKSGVDKVVDELSGVKKAFVEKETKPQIDWGDPTIKAAMEKAGMKGMALSDAAKKMGYDMSKQKDYFAFEEAIAGGMDGWPKEIKEQVIRAKYGDLVDQRLLNNMLADDDPYRLAEVMATIEQGLKMQETGMGPDEIVTSIKESLDRKPNAAGGGVGSMFRGI